MSVEAQKNSRRDIAESIWTMRKGFVIGALAGGLALSAATAAAGDVVKVTSGAELAAAIVLANSDRSIETIKCVSQGGCDFVGALPTYTGSHRLTIDGKDSTIDASGITESDAFAATGGGKLKLMRLNFLGGMSGIYVEVPAGKQGNQRVELQRVTVSNAALHGVHISDSTNADAGIRLIVRASKIIANGFGGDDQDGVRVDETGEGQVFARVLGSLFRANGSDGLSLDETGAGGVSVNVARSKFLSNGPNPANLTDPDDGFDVDERGAGDVWLMISDSRFNKNFDDGIDIDERDGGTIFSNLEDVKANKNLDQGVSFDERLNGDVFATINDSIISGNDAGSQDIDLRGRQIDGGSGTLTLENVIIGKSALTGVELITLP